MDQSSVFKEVAVQRFLVSDLTAKGYEVAIGQRASSGIIDIVATSDDEQLVIEVKGEDKGGY